MVVVHARRLQTGVSAHDSGWLEAGLRALMWAEPFIAASFLFIVGFSLVLARRRYAGGVAWRRRLLRRAATLYALAILLFLPQYGWQWPDALASPGVLSAIAVAIAAVGTALGSARPAASLGALALAGLLVTGLLDAVGLTVAGLNGGPGGVFPLVSFASAGALAALLQRRRGTRGLAVATSASLPLLGACLASGASWVTRQPSLYLDYGGNVAGLSLLEGLPQTRTVTTFWNHSSIGAVGLLPLLGASLLLFVAPQHQTMSLLPFRLLRLLGRQALAVYVGHLLVLGVISMAGMGPTSAFGTWLLVAMLTALAAAFAAAWEQRRAASRGTSPPPARPGARSPSHSAG